MQYIYAGAPAFSVPPLQQMLAAGFCVCAVLTRPDRPVGRRARLTPTPLKAFAQEAGIPVLDYERVRDHAADLAALGADALVTCAYGQILTQEVLDAFPRGVYNIHASLLPRWRGASPIQHAVWAGDAETGITVMRTDVGLDTGDVLLRRALPLDGTETAAASPLPSPRWAGRASARRSPRSKRAGRPLRRRGRRASPSAKRSKRRTPPSISPARRRSCPAWCARWRPSRSPGPRCAARPSTSATRCRRTGRTGARAGRSCARTRAASISARGRACCA